MNFGVDNILQCGNQGQSLPLFRFECNVEAAVKHHPNQTVCLLLHTDDREMVRHLERDLQSTLPAFHNASRRSSSLRVLPMSLDQVFDRTPLFRWWQEELQYSLSKWKTNHLSDAARLAFLWKYGGMYLDHGTRKHDV